MALQMQQLSREQLAALDPTTFDLTDLSEDRLAFAPPRGCFLVVQDGDTCAACAGFRPIAPKACQIAHFVVSYEYRGRGLGGKLMRALLAAARAAGYTRVVSRIEPWCPEWRAFYQAHGFAFVDEGEAVNPNPTAATAVELSLV